MKILSVFRSLSLAGVLLLPDRLPAAPPFINEFLAINDNQLFDDLRRTSDWIEIKNPGPGAVDLAGWSLTDEPDISAKWVFPAVTLNAGEFVVVRASGMDRRDPGQSLHTNFTLSGSGEFLALYSPESVPASVWQPYPQQFSGVSYGSVFSGASRGYFTAPTPGGDNELTALTDYARDTHFDVERGFFTAPFAVTITTSTPGAEIRYTTDGSLPDETGTLYTAPITIPTTTVLRARAFKTGLLPSNTDTQTYIFATTWKTQANFPAGFPQTWGAAIPPLPPTIRDLADYGMNTAITNHVEYGPLIIPAMTQTLPVLCMSGRLTDIFGDNSLHGNLRQTDAERPVGVEYFDPVNGGGSFSARGTLQIHGAAVRDFAKKAFRVDFTGAFGDGPLRFPLFAGSVAETFDQLVLRPCGHDSFTVKGRGGNIDANDHAFHASYLRDQFLRRTENEIGLLSPRGRYVHLCLNGLYWGIYDLHERPNADFCAKNAGGDPSAWDVLHHSNINSSSPPQVIDGTDEAWSSLQSLAATPVLSNAHYGQLAALLGPDRFIDHLLIRMWAGDHDWLGPAYMPSSTQGTTANVAYFSGKNWYAVRNTRAAEPGAWRFFTWDGEISMGNHLLFYFFDFQSVQPAGLDFPHFRELHLDMTGVSRENTPAAPWAALSAHPEFRLKVADRAQRLLFNGGALTPSAAAARIAALAEELDLPIVAESARWGAVAARVPGNFNGMSVRFWDSLPVMTRNTNWRPEVAWLRTTFAIQRGGILLNQLRARALYPVTEPVEITPHGGLAGDVPAITLSASAGTIYYTVDGSDPRVAFSGVPAPAAMIYTEPFPGRENPVPYTVKARALNGVEWSALTEAPFTSNAIPPVPGTLAFTEIHYHPAPPSAGEEAALGFSDADAFEFLEITNVTGAPVLLDSLRFAAGVDFDFAIHSSLRELAPGAAVVLGSHAAAFQLRYGFVAAGIFANATRLSNSGERLKLVRTDGVVIAEFDYNDRGDWPAAADGGGYSLNLLSPGTADPDPGENWHVAAPTPGQRAPDIFDRISLESWSRDFFTAEEITAGLITGPLADPDADGLVNVVEFLTKSNPRRPSSPPITLSFPLPGKVRFHWERRAGDTSGYRIELQTSLDAISWTSSAGSSSGPDNRAKVQAWYDVDLAGATRRFARLRATPLP